MSADEYFRCEPLRLKHTRSSCAAMHRSAKANEGATPGSAARIRGVHCVGCAIGAAHARGERPDVELAQLSAPRSPVEQEERAMKVAKLITVDGRAMTGIQWAAELGVAKSTIYRDGVAAAAGRVAELLAARRPAKAEKPARSATPGTGGRAKRAEPPTSVELPRIPPELPRIPPELVYRPPVGILELGAKLGYVLEDFGAHPRGRLVLVVD